MDIEMPLFLENKTLYREVDEEESFRLGKYKIHFQHYELSKEAPQKYKESYEEFCKKIGESPIYY